MFLANLVEKGSATVFERGERLGRKLSATGNGQGNITNAQASTAEYFSVSGNTEQAKKAIAAYDQLSLVQFFEGLGVLCFADERGRTYPTSRQASSLTDALRFSLTKRAIDVRLKTKIIDLQRSGGGFLLTAEGENGQMQVYAEKVVLCAGGKAAKNFGTDGSVYALAQGLGHTVTPLYPSLVQIKTETRDIKTLKGIRVVDGGLTVVTPNRKMQASGDIIFTDYGVSGDAVFRLSAFIADEIHTGQCRLELDFLPNVAKETIEEALRAKGQAFPTLPVEELLFGVVNNQIGRAIFRRAGGDIAKAAALVKRFPLTVTGSLGFDYAQVTKGGVPLTEVTDALESKKAKGLYFAGEILDVDGQCGGFNLQWAYSSACVVAASLAKEGGQVCV